MGNTPQKKDRHLIDWFALSIAIISIGVSWYTFSKSDTLSKNAFHTNFRPYVSAVSFSYIDPKTQIIMPDMTAILFKIYNAPAFIKKEKLSFYIRRFNGVTNEEKLIYEREDFNNAIFYPYENYQNYVYTDRSKVSKEIAEGLLPNETMIRKVDIQYQWISDSSLVYYFKGEWKYDHNSENFIIVQQSAN